MSKLISVIVPCYNEEQALPFFYDEIRKISSQLESYSFEYIFINDGSKDRTLSMIKEWAETDERVKYVSFSRNFGKESAIYRGLKASRGDLVTLMDADLQDPPKLLFEMLKAVEEEGYDCAAARRVSRKGEPPIRSFFARLFYRLMNRISKTEIADGARDYRLMTRQYVDSLLSLAEYNRFSKGLFGWVGFDTKWIEYENVNRVRGETKWSFWKLFIYSIDGITAFSTTPLVLSALVGLLFCGVAFIAILFIVIRTLVFGDPVAGWPSMVCIIIFLGGIQLLSLGVLGEYLSKAYMEIKNRPIYIRKETNIENAEDKD